MNAHLKAKWLAALRSGEFKQITKLWYGTDGVSYCAGGLLGRVGGCSRPYAKDIADRINHEGLHTVTFMNDSGHSFSEIADWIEANIPSDPDWNKIASQPYREVTLIDTDIRRVPAL